SDGPVSPCFACSLLFASLSGLHRPLHSFPTRRSSDLAAILEPLFSWRVLWLLGLPTGMIVIFLNRYIPESPRFLANAGLKREARSEEHTSELQSRENLVCRLLLEKKNQLYDCFRIICL